MKITTIISTRYCDNHYSRKIVYEWEDVLAASLGLKIVLDFLPLRRFWWFRGIWHRLLHRTYESVPIIGRPSVCFLMKVGDWDENKYGKPNIIPVVIDFWCKTEDDFNYFYERFRKNPAVIITSREAYEILRKKFPSFRLFHWALSVPDKYVKPFLADKKYDCAVVGRPNPLMDEWLRKYAEEHPGFNYIYNKRRPGCRFDYYASDGTRLGDVLKSRKSYYSFLRSVRVGLYSTPSMDNSKVVAQGLDSANYNQVTPRYLEYIACGCHVISRHPKNPDTDYFEVEKMSPCVHSYEEFAAQMDYARTHDIDQEKYAAYLSKHVTSTRAKELVQILERI